MRHEYSAAGRAAAWAEAGWEADDMVEMTIICDDVRETHRAYLARVYLDGGMPALDREAPGVADLVGLAAALLAEGGENAFEALTRR